MEPVYQYPNALDELCGQVTPEQFTCLLSVLSSSDSSKSTLAEIDNDEFSNNTSTFQGTSWSNSSRQSSSEHDKARDLEILRNKRVGFYEKQFDKFTLPLPSAITKLNERPSLLQLSSFDSTITPTKSGENLSSFSRFGVTSKDSMLALKGVTALEDNLADNIYLAETKYSQFPLPIIEFRGEKVGDDDQILTYHNKHMSCFHLPVCKRIMDKCMMMGHMRKSRSRSSSVESVVAETLPDLDNSLLNIAGKIANEPVNQFPVLRKVHSKKSSYSTASSISKREPGGKVKSNVYKIEQEFTKELDKFQDFKDVSEFFSHPKYEYPTRKAGRGYNLSKRVSNPLYKEYDPTGYHKNEDELALECMQMICDDFNKWIQSLSDTKKKSSKEKEHVDADAGVLQVDEESSETKQETQVIDPEFLIQILRRELELPE